MNPTLNAVQPSPGVLTQCAWISGFALSLKRLGLDEDWRLLTDMGCDLYDTLHDFTPKTAAKYTIEALQTSDL